MIAFRRDRVVAEDPPLEHTIALDIAKQPDETTLHGLNRKGDDP